jgi:hypothetical protein
VAWQPGNVQISAGYTGVQVLKVRQEGQLLLRQYCGSEGAPAHLEADMPQVSSVRNIQHGWPLLRFRRRPASAAGCLRRV